MFLLVDSEKGLVPDTEAVAEVAAALTRSAVRAVSSTVSRRDERKVGRDRGRGRVDAVAVRLGDANEVVAFVNRKHE